MTTLLKLKCQAERFFLDVLNTAALWDVLNSVLLAAITLSLASVQLSLLLITFTSVLTPSPVQRARFLADGLLVGSKPQDSTGELPPDLQDVPLASELQCIVMFIKTPITASQEFSDAHFSHLSFLEQQLG